MTTSNIMLDGSSPMDDEEEKIVPPRTKGIQRSSMVFVLLIYSVYESLELDDEKKKIMKESKQVNDMRSCCLIYSILV